MAASFQSIDSDFRWHHSGMKSKN